MRNILGIGALLIAAALALAAVGALPACSHVSSLASDAGTETDTMDTDSHEFSLDGPCDSNELVGGFSVEARNIGTLEAPIEHSEVTGAIADGVNWGATPVLREDAGECELYEFSPWDCTPACEAGAMCNDEGECVPYPTNLDVGTVVVDGLVVPVQIEPDASFDYTYQGPDLPCPPYEPGQEILLRVEGGSGIDEMILDGMGVEKLEVESIDYHMSDNEEMVVTWIPGDTPEAEVHGEFSINEEGSFPMWIYCTWDDAAGSGTVPASLVHELMVDLLESPLMGDATATLERRTVDSIQIDHGCIEFRVSAQLKLNLTYDPPSVGGGV